MTFHDFIYILYVRWLELEVDDIIFVQVTPVKVITLVLLNLTIVIQSVRLRYQNKQPQPNDDGAVCIENILRTFNIYLAITTRISHLNIDDDIK